MALLRKTIKANSNIQDLYIVPSGFEAIIISISVTNNDITEKRTIFKIYDKFNIEKHNIVINTIENETKSYDSKIFLESNDMLKVVTSEGETSVLLSGTEEIYQLDQISDVNWIYVGNYNENLEYSAFNIVRYYGNLYLSKHDVPRNKIPTNEAYWDLFLEKGLPYIDPGTIVVFPMNNIPSGWLKCNGVELSRITYANLYNVIGNLYGSGDDLTTFNIPDLRGEFIRGWDDNRGIDIDRGLGTFQQDLYRSHNHSSSRNVRITGSGSYGIYSRGASWQNGSYNLSSIMHNSGGEETRPRNISMIYCIKY